MAVCIFRSIRTNHSSDEYEIWSRTMDELVRETPGYLHHLSFRDSATRQGITISYFDGLESLDRWRLVPRHVEAQQLGREIFYDEYTIEVATVIRDYTWSRKS